MGRLFPITQVAPKCNHKCPHEREAGISESERFDDAILLALKMEEGPMSQQMKATFLGAGKDKETGFPPEPLE